MPIIYPVFALTMVTGLVWIWSQVAKIKYIKEKGIAPQELRHKVDADALFAKISAPADNFRSLLEEPVLFYVLTLLIMVQHRQDFIYSCLAWDYVGLRSIHSCIQISYNNVTHRFVVYLLSWLVLLALWIRFGYQTI